MVTSNRTFGGGGSDRSLALAFESFVAASWTWQLGQLLLGSLELELPPGHGVPLLAVLQPALLLLLLLKDAVVRPLLLPVQAQPQVVDLLLQVEYLVLHHC